MVAIYADGADIKAMMEMAKNPVVRGFTTNPTLMRKAGVKNYKVFAYRVIAAFPTYPLSLEVFSDDIKDMESQARKIGSWGDNVYVKIPITNTKGNSCCSLISRLAGDGIKVNVTAVFCQSQIDDVYDALSNAKSVPAVISVFAGRIADTGRDPSPTIKYALSKKRHKLHEVLWASPRQVLDVYTAESLGCDIITCTPEIIAKLPLEGKSLSEYSLETVKMFRNDAKAAEYEL